MSNRRNLSVFARRLRTLRQAAGLTIADLAEASGLAWTTVQSAESGARADPRWSTVVALAEGLGVSTDAFRDDPASCP